MEGDPPGRRRIEACDVRGVDDLGEVPGELAQPAGALGVVRIVGEQVAVLAHHRAAAAGRDDDGLGPGLHLGPPGVDVAAHEVQPLLVGREMVAHRPAAPGTGDRHQGDIQAIQDPRCGCVDLRRDPGLGAALEHQHAPGVARGRAGGGPAAGRDLALERNRLRSHRK